MSYSHSMFLFLVLSAASASAADQVVITGPTGSGLFGEGVTVLPNGNIAVLDLSFDLPGVANVGALHLYRPDGTLISTLRGSNSSDLTGAFMVLLSNGNFVLCSRNWDNGSAVDAGAATWVSAQKGLSGVISATNSLVGTRAADRVGENAVALNNGHYVVLSPQWNSDAASDVGAATWGMITQI